MGYEYTFYNVAPGVHYADMKVGVDGIWSSVIYWKVEVPEWYPPAPTPTPTLISTPTPTERPFIIKALSQFSSNSLFVVILIVASVGFGISFIIGDHKTAKKH